MSLTITQQITSSLWSAGNNAFYVVSGSFPNGSTNRKYLADIYIIDAGGTGSFIRTQESYPDPDFGCGVFNPCKILSNFVTYDFTDRLQDEKFGIFHTGSNSWIKAHLQFGREWTDSQGNFNQSIAEAISNDVSFFNGSLPFVDATNVNFDAFLMTPDGTPSAFLTNYYSSDFDVYNPLRKWLYYYNFPSGSAGGLSTIFVHTYNDLGLIGEYSFVNPWSGSEGVQYFACGYPQLAQLDPSAYTVLSGSANIIDLSNPPTSYGLQLNSLITGSDGSSTFFIDFDDAFFVDSDGGRFIVDFSSGSLPEDQLYFSVNCLGGRTQGNYYCAYWLGPLGSIESWMFSLKNTLSVGKTTSTSKKSSGMLKADGTFQIKQSDQATAPYFTSYTDTVTLCSDFLTDEESLFLKYLVLSPAVWIQDADGNLVAVTIKNSTVEVNKKANNKKFFLTIECEVSQTNYAQTL